MTAAKLICSLLVAAGVVCAQQASQSRSSQEQKPSAADPAAKADVAARKELLGLMDKLEPKLPSELRRKLIIISMKIATGWCSPYLAMELEDEIKKLPASERQDFEAEWKAVREHQAWPRMPAPKPAGPMVTGLR